MRMRAVTWLALVCACIFIGSVAAVRAQPYPTHPVKIIVPFPVGGPLDLVARIVGDKLSASLGQPFIVENRAGAAGNLGTEVVAKAPPDGYTLLIVLGSTLAVNPALYKSLPFDPAKDFRPLSLLVNSSQMLVVHPSVPVSSLAEFVAYAKAHPISYAHAGYGSPGHLAMEYLRLEAGFPAAGVPYKGNAPLVNDLLGGQVQAGFVSSGGVIQHVIAGRLKGLAVSLKTRTPLAPNIPTVAESGYPNFAVATYMVMLAPAHVPDHVAQQLESKVREALNAPDIQAKLRAQDLTPVASSGKEAAAILADETKLWAGVVEKTHMQIDQK